MANNDMPPSLLFVALEETGTITMLRVALEESARREKALRKYMEEVLGLSKDPIMSRVAKQALGYHEESLDQHDKGLIDVQQMNHFIAKISLPQRSEYDDVGIEYNIGFPDQWRQLKGKEKKRCVVKIQQLMHRGPAWTAQQFDHRVVPAHVPRIVPDNCVESDLGGGVRLYWQLLPKSQKNTERKIAIHSIIAGGTQLGIDPFNEPSKKR